MTQRYFAGTIKPWKWFALTLYLKAIKGNISAQHAYFLETAKMYQQERAQFDYNY